MEVVDIKALEKKYNKAMMSENLQTKLAKAKLEASQKGPKDIPMSLKIREIKGIAKKRQLTATDEPKRKTKIQDPEIKEGIKKIILKTASFPVKGEKQKLLNDKLNKSHFLESYINNNLCVDYLENLNDHMKAILIYGYHVFDVMATDLPVVLPVVTTS